MALKNPTYITQSDGSYKYHGLPYQFGALELQGLKIFLSAASAGAVKRTRGQLRGVPPSAGLFGFRVP